MASESKPVVMTRAEYARHRGKSRQYISQLAKAGVLIMRGGKIDVRATDLVLDDRPVDDVTEPPGATPATPVAPVMPASRPAADSLGGQAGASFGQARTIEMVFRAKLRRLEFETKQGRLIQTRVGRHGLLSTWWLRPGLRIGLRLEERHYRDEEPNHGRYSGPVPGEAGHPAYRQL